MGSLSQLPHFQILWVRLAQEPVKTRIMKVLTDESREEDLPDKATESLVSEQVPGVQLCYAERRDSSATICCPSLNLFLQKILAKQSDIYE